MAERLHAVGRADQRLDLLAATSSWSSPATPRSLALTGTPSSAARRSPTSPATATPVHTTYDATNSANSALNGGTYTLAGGGALKPASLIDPRRHFHPGQMQHAVCPILRSC
ncbi:MAG: hypothetical protein U0838_12305 [Chloroflexota bacterium]